MAFPEDAIGMAGGALRRPVPTGQRNVVVLWSNVAPRHTVVVWQVVQSVEKAAAVCAGILVWSNCDR
ncbi:MAG: hypothetical protein IPP98_10175 [Gemmatimonadetes bacterium]|nr:hypothetical protein [Gemmatimonadota bacterium]